MTLSVRQRGAYPAEWHAIAQAVKHEADWRCVRCGHVHDPAAGRMLTVHHFDGDRGRNDRWNLMALCQKCHLSVQARVNPYLPYFALPSTWSMPYIAGFWAAGLGTPCPLWGEDTLTLWIRMYIAEARKPWPAWAPTPDTLADRREETHDEQRETSESPQPDADIVGADADRRRA